MTATAKEHAAPVREPVQSHAAGYILFHSFTNELGNSGRLIQKGVGHAVEALYRRILAGHPEEAIDDAEDMLAGMPLASYFDDVVLPGLRLAISDLDRGAVSRSALKTSREAVLAVVAGSIAVSITLRRQHADEAPPGDHLLPRAHLTVLCFPARGPLDAVVAAMLVHSQA